MGEARVEGTVHQERVCLKEAAMDRGSDQVEKSEGQPRGCVQSATAHTLHPTARDYTAEVGDLGASPSPKSGLRTRPAASPLNE